MPARFGRPISYALTAAATAALALPAAALAGSGGAGLGGGPGPVTTPTTTTPAPTTQDGNAPVSAAGDGITLNTTTSAILRRGLTFSGTTTRAVGTTIEIERSGRQTHWRWASTAVATVGSGGAFEATWSTNHIGRFAIRAVVVPAGVQPAAVVPAVQSAATTTSVTVTVYRPSRATLYGPGFYGRRTACGQRLTRTTIGVASRTLRCGESVALYYRGRTLVVPVIDRGPYANGADWDLTIATGAALGITGTEQIGAVSLPRAPACTQGGRARAALTGPG